MKRKIEYYILKLPGGTRISDINHNIIWYNDDVLIINSKTIRYHVLVDMYKHEYSDTLICVAFRRNTSDRLRYISEYLSYINII